MQQDFSSLEQRFQIIKCLFVFFVYAVLFYVKDEIPLPFFKH